jgi:hypothetical protein
MRGSCSSTSVHSLFMILLGVFIAFESFELTSTQLVDMHTNLHG